MDVLPVNRGTIADDREIAMCVEPCGGAEISCAGGGAATYEVAPMHFQFAEIFGVTAALASLYAAHSKTMIPLRWAAIAANALAMVYSALHGTWPTFALNAILLPTNAWRLYAMLRLIGDIESAIKSDMNADWLLP